MWYICLDLGKYKPNAMAKYIIGRLAEIKILENSLHSSEAELIAITGRRRIGKTFLTTSVYQEQIVFEMIGTQNGTLETQLLNFAEQLTEFSNSPFPINAPKNWTEAFSLIRKYLQNISLQDKKVLFFDELPWLSGQKSGFLDAFGYFWNSWASRQNLVIVICGSAASWMIQKVVNDKGGLHNRISKHIHLEPFTLAETKAFLESREVFYDHYQILQLYMVTGGVPHYLKDIDGSKSVIQNIDALCFSKTGVLYDEFNRLYHSLFTNADNHLALIRVLATKKQGMSRNEIAKTDKLDNGGGLTRLLEELIWSGFVTEIYPYGKKKKEKIYRLTDEYSLFYLQFIESNRQQGTNVWQNLSQTQTYKSWSGYAYESICIKHIERIKQALSISGIYSSVSSFYQQGDEENDGVQIDMLLDRNDHTINLFEIKFYNQPYILNKESADKLRQKQWRFQAISKTKKHINWLIISTFGLQKNQYSTGLISNSLSMEDLF
jgi:uncharacterized protein